MRNHYAPFLAACLLACVFFSSCQKDKTTDQSPDETIALQSVGDDRALFDNEIQSVTGLTDHLLEIYAEITLDGRNPLIFPSGCDYAVTVNEGGGNYQIQLDFNGSGCNGVKKRSGQLLVTIPLGFIWSAEGASYQVEYKNIKLTRESDNKSVTLNGKKTIKNVMGGLVRKLEAGSMPVVHAVYSDGLNFGFDNGTASKWNISRLHTYTFDGGYVLSVTNLPDYPQETGKNRFGKSFSASITSPLILRESCGYRLSGGSVNFNSGYTSSNIKFGLTSDGNQEANCADNNLFYKFSCTGQDGKVFYTAIGAY